MSASLLSASRWPNRTTLHPREVASALGVSVRQVQRWAQVGLIVAIRISCGNGRAHLRVPVTEYDRIIQQGGVWPPKAVKACVSPARNGRNGRAAVAGRVEAGLNGHSKNRRRR